MTIALAVFLFDLRINLTNAIGIILTLIGGVSHFRSAFAAAEQR